MDKAVGEITNSGLVLKSDAPNSAGVDTVLLQLKAFVDAQSEKNSVVVRANFAGWLGQRVWHQRPARDARRCQSRAAGNGAS